MSYGLGALGTAAEDAVWTFKLAMKRLTQAIIAVGDYVDTDPVRAIQAEATAKAELAKAEAAWKLANSGGVLLPPNFRHTLATARRGVEHLGPIVSQAQANVQDATQVDPAWTSPRYSREDFPPAPTSHWEDEPEWPGRLYGLGGRSRRRRRH